jgi:hypothetical protein
LSVCACYSSEIALNVGLDNIGDRNGRKKKSWEINNTKDYIKSDETFVELSFDVILVLTHVHKEDCVCLFVLYTSIFQKPLLQFQPNLARFRHLNISRNFGKPNKHSFAYFSSTIHLSMFRVFPSLEFIKTEI